MSNSRSKNVFFNIFFGYIAQFGILLLSFIGRKIFIQFLSADYLGVNGLYSNILSVLSLAELGLGSVTQFFLYKPVAEDNKDLVIEFFSYFKKLYAGIASVVMVLGLSLIPFLKYIVNSKLPQTELVIYYVLFLSNSIVTYFSAPHIALLAANQDNRLHKLVTLLTNFILQFLHIGVLLVWRNYTVYVITTLFTSVCNVMILNYICKKKYDYINSRATIKKANKLEIIKSVKSTFFYKIGAVIVNNTDNILISIIVSTATVGLYSNYFMVISGIQSFITVVTTSLISSIGNLSTQRNKERLYSVFNTMLLVYNFIATFGGIAFYFLFDDLITIWLGEEYLMNNAVVFAIAFNFYLSNAISPIWMYREANGLFNKVRYLMLIVAICNIVLSVLLGKIWGTFGILIATSISRLITQVWYEPRILFKIVLDKPQKLYWLLQLKYVLLAVLSVLCCYIIINWMPHDFMFMIIKAVVILLICVVVFFIGNFKSNEYRDIIKFLTSIICKTKSQKIFLKLK